MKTWMTKALLLVSGLALSMSGVLLRPFWLSEWGPITFIFLVWLVMSVVFGWAGKGKPYSIRFGLIVGSGIALTFLATFYTNSYVGIGLLLALIYLGVKTKFFERRWAE
ncbi:hypothetical protein ACIPSK_18740 [Rhizobium sp. LARHSG275]